MRAVKCSVLFRKQLRKLANFRLNARIPDRYSRSVRTTDKSLLLALALAVVMIFARLGQLPLRDPDEGRNSEVAREMQLAGAWLTPTYNGLVYLDKPSFFFKSVALCFAAFGESEMSARLPSALAAAAIIAMAIGFCRREYNDKTAAIAVAIIATAPSFIALARHVIFDMMLTAFICAAIFAGYFAEFSEGSRARNLRILAAACSGLATLVKGPVGFIVPTLVLAVFFIVEKRAGWWRRHFHPLNILVFFAMTLPWFIGLSILHPDFPRYGLLEESLKRFTTPAFSRSAPFYYFGLVLLGGLFAWSALMPEAIAVAWRRRTQLTRADRLLIIWSIVVVIFFSLSKSKLPHYILSAIVTMSMLLARVFAIGFAQPESRAARLALRSLLVVAALSLGAFAFVVFNLLRPDAAQKIFKIHSREFDAVALIFPTMAVILGLIAGFALLARFSRNMRLAFATFLVLPLCMITFGFSAIGTYLDATSSRKLADAVAKLPPQTTVACLQSLAPGLPFYLKRPITLITADGSEISPYIVYSLRDRADWPTGVVKVNCVDAWIASHTNAVLVLANHRAKRSLQEFAERHHVEVSPIAPDWSAAMIVPQY
jgi:4-amino-4-deoxy-L-arabinose transferase-like glycosyltransferase